MIPKTEQLNVEMSVAANAVRDLAAVGRGNEGPDGTTNAALKAMLNDMEFRRGGHCVGLTRTPNTPEILTAIAKLSAALPELKFTGNIVSYNPGATMGWHTNEEAPGLRTYIVWNEQAGSVFRYSTDGKKIVDIPEDAGWHIKTFEIPKEGLFWHAIKAGKGKRIAIGFMGD